MLVGPNGRPITSKEGPTGRVLVLREVMIKDGAVGLNTEAQGAWFKDASAPEQMRGRLLIAKYFMDAANAILRDMLGTFVDREVNQEVQQAINNLAKETPDGV